MERKAPKGTRDILPEEARKWQYVEGVVRDICEKAGYGEIRTPIFEHTELFERGIGTGTDIVEKEMYTFLDRSNRSITLRPEGTAPVVRAYLEHNMHAGPQPVKLYYMGPMFRYERPQSGRYRQFWQFGAEILGAAGPLADAEVIAILLQIYGALGLSGCKVALNTIGCPVCRPAYREELKRTLGARIEDMCPDCRRRFSYNPLRILDCKREECQEAIEAIPDVVDFLCDDCRGHFARLRDYLSTLGISYFINPRIVRGLDYYTRTVFEVAHPALGAQDVLGAGGRYDGLAEECGGPPTPGVGFASGIDRVILALDAEGALPDLKKGVGVFVVAAGEGSKERALRLVFELRKAGLRADMDYMDRSLKSQMRLADRLQARYALILGEEEMAKGTVQLRDMQRAEQREVPQEGLSALLVGLERRS